MKHTPTPWEILGATIIIAPETAYICELCDPKPEANQKLELRSPKWDEGIANAQFIVKACNCHDELLEALKNAKVAFDHMSRSERVMLVPVIGSVEAAIAKVERRELIEIHPSGVTREEFQAYESVRVSGVTNMLEELDGELVRHVSELSDLGRETIITVIKNYTSLMEFYPGVRREL